MIFLLSCVLNPVCKCLVGELVEDANKAYHDVKDCGDQIATLQTEAHQLKIKSETIDQELKDAIKKGKEPVPGVEKWIKEAKTLESEASLLEIEFQKSTVSLYDYALNFKKLLELSKKAKDKLHEAEVMKKDGDFHDVAREPSPDYTVEKPGGTLLGMEAALELLEIYMNDADIRIFGICGMGRVGKSTVLKRFCSGFNDRMQIYIDMHEIGMAHLDDQHKVEAIQNSIMQQFGNQQENMPSDKASHIHTRLKNMKFLLMLDNLCEYIDLKSLGIPNLQDNRNGRVILSTRFTNICNEMEAKFVRVECLSLQDAWTLFKEKAGETAQKLMKDKRIRELALDLVRKCDGLPEALINVGYAVAGTESQDQWHYIIQQMDTKPWKIANMEKVLHSLKLSYDMLDEKLKKCLLYCSLYPAGFSINKEWIIDYCMNEGLFDKYTEGLHYLGQLKVKSLLDSGRAKNQIRMHPMIHAMVLWIACERGDGENRWLVQAKLKLTEAPKDWAGAQRVSLMRNKIVSLPPNPNGKELETLMLQVNTHLKQIPDGFFMHMPILKVLDLSQTAIEKLPAGIGSLLSLQYLNVSDTKIKSLPKELGELLKLRFLLLSRTPIETVAEGVIAKLTELQVFFIDFSFGNWRVGSSGTGVDIEEFESLNLMALGISVESKDALLKLSKYYLLEMTIESLNSKADQVGLDDEEFADLKRSKTELDALYHDDDQMWWQRAKKRWPKEGDLNTRFFHQWASLKWKRNQIHRLICGQIEVTAQDGVEAQFRAFYSHLLGKGRKPLLHIAWEELPPPGASLIWRGIAQLKEVFAAGTTLQAGRGDIFRLWRDRWLDGRSLAELFPHMFHLARHPEITLRETRISGCIGLTSITNKSEEDDDGGDAYEDKEDMEAAATILEEDIREDISPFPYLKSLELIHLPELKSLSEGKRLLLPSLEHLRVVNCPKLNKLWMATTKVPDVLGEDLWWNKLEWDEGCTKPKFTSLVE
ncbi:Disease resistance protein RPS2 [Canna indica]|uniref:Disease resistance protein RPS2 n=1 Tax=Canna indica TaxID=4628 RepID=A0AAQ3QQM3_9LILI|nr:Disease resistance protein RPS2 [Canna indica]